jgi:hypothetical protein
LVPEKWRSLHLKKTPLDKKIIASRLQEINEGLTRISSGLVEAHYRKSKKFGAAARVCSLIRGRNVIKNYDAIVAAAGELGISADTLESALSSTWGNSTSALRERCL